MKVNRQKTVVSMLVLTIVFSLFVAACGSNNASLTIATGVGSGIYSLLGGSMAQLFEKSGIPVSERRTTASVENMRLLKGGEVEIAFTQSDIVDYASKGMLMFEDGGSIDNIEAVTSLYNETVQVIVAKDSPIQS